MGTTTKLGPADVATNPYLGRTAAEPRPTRESFGPWPGLEERQRQWADENVRLREARHAEVEAKRQAERERAERRQEAEAAAKREAIAERLKARFLAEGGSLSQWTAVRDELVLEHLKRAALGEDDAARAASARRYG